MAFELQMTWQPSLHKIHKNRIDDGPIGLQNLGNACYINSVLQCLTHTAPLANLCLQEHHSSNCDSGPGGGNCPFCIVERRVARSLITGSDLDAPFKIRDCLGVFSEQLWLGREEDAHEFLDSVIGACHRACLRLGRDGAGNGRSSSTVVREIFGGALKSQIRCLSCGAESDSLDEIMCLNLQLSGCDSVLEALKGFFEPELLEGSNQYECQNCNKSVKAQKQLSLYQAPNVLVIQLKRFGDGGKIDKYIAFEEFLELSSFMCKTVQDPKPEYNLYGTIVHSGLSVESGHYYAYIKDVMERWFRCNDFSVSVSTLQQVLSEKVYILFFARAEQRPAPGLSNGLKKSCDGNEASKSLKVPSPLKPVHTKPSSPNGNGKNSVHTDGHDRPMKGHSNNSGSKRKSPESCILLARDSQSQAEVDKLKEVLEKKARLVLHACGWSDEVYRSMHSRKRLCTREAGNSPLLGAKLKKLLIDKAKPEFNSRIPEMVKTGLIGLIQPIYPRKTENFRGLIN